MTTADKANPDVYSAIVEWGLRLPLWQNQLIRQVAVGGPLSDAAVAELADTALRESESQEIGIARLSRGDFPTRAATENTVRLTSVGSLSNVNALEAGQTMAIGPGLTVVYGPNASGKSGYARVLKKVFRARVVEPILPNLREDPKSAASPAAATFEFQDSTGRTFTIRWQDGDVLPEECATFAVLDASCSRTYIVANELSIVPDGLDVPARAASEVDRVKQHLLKRASDAAPDKSRLAHLQGSTATGRFIGSLSAVTSTAEIDAALQFGERDEEELAQSIADIAALSGASLADARRANQAALDGVSAVLKFVTDRRALIAPSVQDAIDAATAAEANAEKEAEEMRRLAAGEILGTTLGTSPWRRLFQAALDVVAVIDGTDDAFSSASACPLCWQDLTPAARQRLRSFAAFFASNAEKEADAARAQRESLLAPLRGVDPRPPDALLAHARSGSEAAASGLAEFCTAFHNAADDLVAGRPARLAELDRADRTLRAVLTRRQEELAAARLAVADEAAAQARLAALQLKRAELETRKQAVALGGEIRSFVKALRESQRLHAVARAVNTQSVSIMASDLDARFLTEAFASAVVKELKDEIRFARHAPVFSKSTTKGKTNMRPVVSETLRNVSAADVFSEGERTAIALAAFLAEVGISGDTTGLIFDDPISSLDDGIRLNVATRLAREARLRQVIVLTHDLCFLADLQKVAKALGIESHYQSLAADEWQVGIIDNEMPFATLGVAKRVSRLRTQIEAVESLGKAGRGREAADEMRQFYARLRSTWERFIEMEVLGGVVLRLERDVHPNQLKDVVLTPEIASKIHEGYGRGSYFFEGHDQPAGSGTQRPTTSDLKADLALLEEARALVKAQRSN